MQTRDHRDRYNFRVAKKLVITLAVATMWDTGVPCYGDSFRSHIRIEVTPSFNQSVHRKGDRDARQNGHRGPAMPIPFVLRFRDPVDLATVGVLTDATGGSEPIDVFLSSLTWDATEWLMDSGRPLAANEAIDLVISDREIFMFIGVPGEMNLLEIVEIDGDGEFIEVLPAVASSPLTVSTILSAQDLIDSNHPIADSGLDPVGYRTNHDNLLGLADSDLVVKEGFQQSPEFPEDEQADGATVAGLVCCTGGGACTIYGGNDCPGGTTSVPCPCGSGGNHW